MIGKYIIQYISVLEELYLTHIMLNVNRLKDTFNCILIKKKQDVPPFLYWDQCPSHILLEK